MLQTIDYYCVFFCLSYKVSSRALVFLLLLSVERIVSGKTIVSVEWVGACRLHVVLVVQPDVVSLLSTKNSESGTNNDGRNDNDCQQTSRDTNDLSSAQSKDARLSITIANLALIDGGAWNLVDKASIPVLGAESCIASSLLLIDGGGEE